LFELYIFLKKIKKLFKKLLTLVSPYDKIVFADASENNTAQTVDENE